MENTSTGKLLFTAEANRRYTRSSMRQNAQWTVFSFHEKHLYSQIAIHGIREKNIRKSRVGEEKILA